VCWVSFFFSSRRRHTRLVSDWSSDVCSSDLWAHGLMGDPDTAVRPHPAAWYDKSLPTFSDAIAAIRRVLWTPGNFSMSRHDTETVEIPARLLKRFVETLCLAA